MTPSHVKVLASSVLDSLLAIVADPTIVCAVCGKAYNAVCYCPEEDLGYRIPVQALRSITPDDLAQHKMSRQMRARVAAFLDHLRVPPS